MALKHLSMTSKIALLIGVLGAVMVAGALLTGGMLRRVSTDYATLLDGPAEAGRSFAVADREIVWIERSILQNIWSTSEATNAVFAAATVDGARRFRDALARTRVQIPERAAAIDALGRRFEGVFAGACTRTIAMANASVTLEGNAKAMAELNAGCGPELAALGKDINTYADDLGRLMKTTAGTLGENAETAIWRNYAFSLGGLALALAAAILMTRSGIVQPIRSLVATMGRMAAGERDIVIPGRDRKDEIGTIARTLDVFRLSLCEADAARMAREQAQVAEAGRLAARNAVSERFVARMMTITDGFVRSSEDVSGAASRLDATAAEAARGTQAVSGAASDASDNVQAVAAATEEMAASVREIAQQVNHALDIASTAVSEAVRTKTDVTALSQAVETVGGVVGLISDIAEQTNLLALNATIEAARAGPAGRGFAVVAQEVKQLAAQTAKATDEITARIVQIQSAADRTVASVEKISGTVETIREISGMIAGAVEEQGSATQDIAVSTQRAAQGATRVTGNIQSIGEAVETTGGASTQLTGLSADLTSRAADLRKEIAAFVAELKAA